jgi:hypothetical protein
MVYLQGCKLVVSSRPVQVEPNGLVVKQLSHFGSDFKRNLIGAFKPRRAAATRRLALEAQMLLAIAFNEVKVLGAALEGCLDSLGIMRRREPGLAPARDFNGFGAHGPQPGRLEVPWWKGLAEHDA